MNRVEIPPEMVPKDAQVEIAAKVFHGYHAGAGYAGMDEAGWMTGRRPQGRAPDPRRASRLPHPAAGVHKARLVCLRRIDARHASVSTLTSLARRPARSARTPHARGEAVVVKGWR